MNLVNQIMNQLSGDALGKLSGLLGTDGETTEQAASAAVPSLLAGLAGLASQAGGTQKITTALGNIDTSTLGNLAHMLGGNSDSLTQKGGSLLSSLFGDSLLSSIATAISRFSGLNAGAAKSLLAALAPMVFGQVASQWKSRGASAERSHQFARRAEAQHRRCDPLRLHAPRSARASPNWATPSVLAAAKPKPLRNPWPAGHSRSRFWPSERFCCGVSSRRIPPTNKPRSSRRFSRPNVQRS